MRGKGEGSIFKDARGFWTGVVELPPGPSGKRRRKVVRRKNKRELLEEMSNVRTELKKRGDLPTKNQTVEQWFTYWLTQIAVKEVRPKTFDGSYRPAVNIHIVPTIGHVKLNKVTAAHVRRVHDRITKDLGLSSTTALLSHRVMSIAFKVAVREGRIGVDPTTLVNAPRKAVAEQEAFDIQEAIAVLEHVAEDPTMGARWATSLLTGARRGEVIGLEIDRVTDVLDLSWQLQRLPITETPGVPVAPADYEYRHIRGGLYWTRPKSRAGWRTIPLVDPLKSIIERHIAASPPNEFGLVFTRAGAPLDPDDDSAAWKQVLAETGIDKDVVLHGLRHTAVDLLLAAGVSEDLIPEIVGHSTRLQSRSYRTRGVVHRERLEDAMQKFSALFSQRARELPDTRPALEE